ncbi:hypothetical protein BBK36DRAFT_1111668 [Trichoderma citrinoviride]|uniref:NACHT domain-containing protein n=1 Tax=Trichoderma citrinoviride TaxID=58853 RepID=A0A2T4BJA1_9HYPO|nr:hypothetical protein BBK36DRAFT_1111668 [Trichoderma citrinoviride]PTB69385.1 hypothetical protein BBK36DRAFT_1111668 [Trichoderma citrinoviride]
MSERKRSATAIGQSTTKRIRLGGSLEDQAADATFGANFRPCNLTKDAFTVGWICALEIELAASVAMLDEELPTSSQIYGDPNTYTLGRMGEHNVVMACLPAGTTGTNAAAAAATNMMRSFPNVRFGLMVGIGGGAPGMPSDDPREDIRLGDVVVSCPTVDSGGVLQYDFGKTMSQGKFVQTGSLNKASLAVRTSVSTLRARHQREGSQIPTHIDTMLRFNGMMRGRFDHPGLEQDQLFRAEYKHIEGESTCECCDRGALLSRRPRQDKDPVIHYGLIGSANQVMRHGLTRDRLREEKGILCFEMEAAGLMDSLPCLVIRGICDYADSHKNKKWQPYAAVTAASYAKEILSVIPAAEVAIPSDLNPSALYDTIRSTVDGMELEQLLQLLPALGQEQRLPEVPKLDPDDPLFAWVFSNMDYRSWMSADGPPVLCLLAPPGLQISRASSCVVEQQKKSNRLVLSFSCPNIVRSAHVTSQSFAYGDISLSAALIYTFLKQIVHFSPICKKILIIRTFFNELLQKIFQNESIQKWLNDGFHRKGSFKGLQELLRNVSAEDLLDAFRIILDGLEQRPSMIVLDGIDAGTESDSIFRHVSILLNDLHRRNTNTKVLLTGQAPLSVEKYFPRVLQIEHDKERNGLFISKQHCGSFEWIWAHSQYESWSAPETSRLLYIQGKPGSGKSTLTKYFDRNLQTKEPAAKGAVVAKFFYSFRDGELQRSHFNMLLALLHDIVYQDEAFFYHRCQFEYRLQRQCGPDIIWDYESLKKILRSLQDYPTSKRFYLVIDAADESEEVDRRNVLSLLYDICSKMKYCVVKIFIASRPVAQLEARRDKALDFIRLQDEISSDIAKFADSLLQGLDLTHLLAQMIDYILRNAHGVFLWVKLVGEELIRFHEDGYSEQEMFEMLKQIPTELKDVYARMLDKMKANKLCLSHGLRMLQFVIFARRPLTVDEVLHSLGVPDSLDIDPALDLSDDSFEKRVPTSERLIISCGGNFLEIKQHNDKRTVQIIHQTVREFFLDATGVAAKSEFRIEKAHASLCLALTCIRYLTICAAGASKRTFSNTPRGLLEFYDYQAQYLDTRPLASYALCYMQCHIDDCWDDVLRRTNMQHLVPLLREYRLHYPVDPLTTSLAALDPRQADPRQRPSEILLAAARGGFAVAVNTLLSARARINHVDASGRTSLSWAAQNGHEAVVKLLLRSYTEVDFVDHSGSTALSWAAGMGRKAIVRLLLANGAKVDLPSSQGAAPRPWATSGTFLSLRDSLLSRVRRCSKCGLKSVPPWLRDHEMVSDEPEHVCKGRDDRNKLHWVLSSNGSAVARLMG